jgi:hypothetical protein
MMSARLTYNGLQACAVRMLKLKTVYTTQAEYKDTNVFERRQNKKKSAKQTLI